MTVIDLWMPILLSAALVFVVSSVIHMLLGYHRADYKGLPEEEIVLDNLRSFNLPEGDYVFPWAANSAEMKTPEYQARMENGPVGFISVKKSWNMGTSLLQWFVYCVVLSAFAGFVTLGAAHEDPSSHEVFHYVMLISFASYFFGLVQNSIWYKRSWMTTFRYFIDSVVYSLATAAVFAWLWPVA